MRHDSSRLDISNRREFLQRLSAAAAVVGAGHTTAFQTAFAKDETVTDALPVIDTHQHLWDLKKFKLPWQAVEDVPALRRDFVMSDYLQATKGLNVVKTVYMEVDVSPEQQMAEADYVTELCKRDDNPMKAAVVSGHPGAAGFEAHVKKLAQNKYIKGIRQVLHVPSTPAGHCLQPKFVEGIQLLGELGLSFDLCVRSGELGDAAKLVAQCPKTRFIVDHCGNMSVTSTDKDARAKWLDGMKQMAAHKNAMCKISGIIVTANKDWKPQDLAPNMNDSMEIFGEDRIMFAGDWPVCTLKASFAQWLNALKTIVKDRPIAFQKKLFHDNAARFYGI
jgi:predicted TIM-barrel fold metal-dependent hydrolase